MSHNTLPESVSPPHIPLGDTYPGLVESSTCDEIKQTQTSYVPFEDMLPYNEKPVDGQKLVGVIQAGEEWLGLVFSADSPIDESTGQPALALTRFSRQPGERARVIGVVNGDEWLDIGRTKLHNIGIRTDTLMSREHCKVKIGNRGIVVEDTSTNGTYVLHRTQGDSLPNWTDDQNQGWSADPDLLRDRFAIEKTRMATAGNVVAVGTRDAKIWLAGGRRNIMGRNLILPDTQVSGGIDVQASKGGVIHYAVTVAKLGQEGPAYKKLLANTESWAADWDPNYNTTSTMSDPAAVAAVYHAVESTVQYSVEGIERLAQAHAANGHTPVLDIEDVLEARTGVCLEMALASGKMLEMLQANGRIPGGTVSIHSNTVWNPKTEKYGGHQWVRFTAEDGDIYIIDVAQRVHGRLRDILSQAEANPNDDS